MNLGYKQSSKRTLFSEEIVSFFKRRSYELFGFFLMLFGLVVLLSLGSYENQDSSWNTMKEGGGLQNIMGSFGSYLSDFFFQFIGLPSYLVSFICFVWGTHVLLFHTLSHLKWRLLGLPLMLLFCSAGLGGIEWSFFVKSGGGLGATLHHAAMFFLSKIGIPGWILSIVLFALGMTLFVLILGVPKEMWLSFGKVILRGLVGTLAWAKKTLLSFKKPEIQPSLSFESSLEVPTETISEEIDSSDMDDYPEPVARETVKPKAIPMFTKSVAAMRTMDGYQFPSLDLLQKEASRAQNGTSLSVETLKENAEHLKNILADFGVQGEVLNSYPGPVVTLYEFKPAPGVKSSRVVGLADDIARSTSSLSTRISVMPGVNALGIEIPNPTKEKVFSFLKLAVRAILGSTYLSMVFKEMDHIRRYVLAYICNVVCLISPT